MRRALLGDAAAIMAAIGLADIDPAVVHAAMMPPPTLTFNNPSRKGLTDHIERVPYTGLTRQQRRAQKREWKKS